MKLSTIFSVLMFILCSHAQSQIFVAYKATEGVSAARKIADAGLTNSQFVGVVTLGDTMSALQLPINAKFFDYKTGKSDGWIYVFRGKSKTTSNDSTLTIPIAKLPLLGFQTIALDLPLAGISSLFSRDSVLPNNFLESDKMILNIQATADYKVYAKANPNPKASFIPVGYTPFSLYFPSNSPIWRLTFGGIGTNGTLNCEVHAITGEAKCTAIAVGVEEETETGDLLITPNPAVNAVSITIPQQLYSPQTTIELYNSIGVKISSYTLSIGSGEKINLPLDGLSDGVYFMKYSGGSISITKPLIIQR
jgi:hypothetical protein